MGQTSRNSHSFVTSSNIPAQYDTVEGTVESRMPSLEASKSHSTDQTLLLQEGPHGGLMGMSQTEAHENLRSSRYVLQLFENTESYCKLCKAVEEGIASWICQYITIRLYS